MQVLNNTYRIIRVLGQGGMSTVYLAEHLQWKNRWAVKQAHKNIGVSFDVLAEPNMLKQLSHPALPHIIDIFEDENDLYIVEEYIEGEDLHHFIARNGPVSEQTAAGWLHVLCDVLIYLHEQNPPIIYRDLKPANIMLRSDGSLCLIDFGIARTYKEGSRSDTLYAGTRGYAAPEQLTGSMQTDPRTDIYALGATIYHFLTGKPPVFLSGTFMPLNSTRPDVSAHLIKIIEKCLSPAMDDRYVSAREILADLYSAAALPGQARTSATGAGRNGPSGAGAGGYSTSKTAVGGHSTSGAGAGKKRSKLPLLAAGFLAAILLIAAAFTGITFSAPKTYPQGISQLFYAGDGSHGTGASSQTIFASSAADLADALFQKFDQAREDFDMQTRYMQLAALLYDAFSREDYTYISQLLSGDEYSGLYSNLCSDLETGERYFLYDPGAAAGNGSNYVLVVYQYGFMYFGQWADTKREGQGVWFAPGDVEELLYQGAWSDDSPNGEGTVYCRAVSRLEEWGDIYPLLQTRTGTFTDGFYDGTFDISWEMSDGTTREYTPVKYSMGISIAMTEEELVRYLQSYGYSAEQATELAGAHTTESGTESAGNDKKTIAICKDSTGAVFSMIELLENGADRENIVFGINIPRSD